jgi:hypothetical protein
VRRMLYRLHGTGALGLFAGVAVFFIIGAIGPAWDSPARLIVSCILALGWLVGMAYVWFVIAPAEAKRNRS